MGTIERETRETSIRVTLTLGGGDVAVDTSVPFLDHMLLLSLIHISEPTRPY